MLARLHPTLVQAAYRHLTGQPIPPHHTHARALADLRKRAGLIRLLLVILHIHHKPAPMVTA